jgi:hypothetical protein
MYMLLFIVFLFVLSIIVAFTIPNERIDFPRKEDRKR